MRLSSRACLEAMVVGDTRMNPLGFYGQISCGFIEVTTEAGGITGFMPPPHPCFGEAMKALVLGSAWR